MPCLEHRAEPLNPAVGAAERGLIIRDLAALAHPHPDGTMRVYSRGTMDRWVRAYRARDLDGLRPIPRRRGGAPAPRAAGRGRRPAGRGAGPQL